MKNFYKDKKILVTGHTGFKGAWLCSWLLSLGAKVYGYSNDIPTSPAMYELAKLERYVESFTGNLLNLNLLSETINRINPDIIFHLAGQPIMSLAYLNPLQAFETNVMGTATILEAVRKFDNPCTFVSITSDKSYLNKEWVWGYRETDELGGKDPYSASKAGAEMVLRSYYHTYFANKNGKRIAVARAGNIIGGGDWGVNRIIPDCIRAWKSNQSVIIRSPTSIRPWQHVIEPLYGYLSLAKELHGNSKLNGEAFNFGPNALEFKNVLFLVNKFSNSMQDKGVFASIIVKADNEYNEAEILKLNCEKAQALLRWKPILNMDEAIEYTASWYFEGHWNNANILDLTHKQIEDFEKKMKETSNGDERA